MKLTLTLAGFIILGSKLLAQADTAARQTDTVYTFVEQMPEFPGDLSRYALENITYPDSARKHNIEGRVYARFVIDANGFVKHVTILRSPGYGCSEEIIRVLEAMPRWRPGRLNGEPVAVYFSWSFNFDLID